MLQRALAALCLLAAIGCSSESGRSRTYNVLFLAIDDLRPELGAYGAEHMVTPNLDRLAATGRLFQRHYVQAPTCGASRYALLTGERPSTPDHLSNEAFPLLLPKQEQERPESFAHVFRRKRLSDGLHRQDQPLRRRSPLQL